AASAGRLRLLLDRSALTGPGLDGQNLPGAVRAGEAWLLPDERPPAGLTGLVAAAVPATGLGAPRFALDPALGYDPARLDLPTRLLLEAVSQPEGAGRRVVPALLAGHPARRQLERVFGTRVPTLDAAHRALARAWLRVHPPAALGPLVVLRHPEAAELAELPELAGLVAFVIDPERVAIQPEKAAEAARILQALGVAVSGFDPGSLP
ncbi:MAG TPA: hypothetical protein VHN99_01810, partial [Deinococcales bacterium]|nr:hypothetical protein [Deinococcales bacterium]